MGYEVWFYVINFCVVCGLLKGFIVGERKLYFVGYYEGWVVEYCCVNWVDDECGKGYLLSSFVCDLVVLLFFRSFCCIWGWWMVWVICIIMWIRWWVYGGFVD